MAARRPLKDLRCTFSVMDLREGRRLEMPIVEKEEGLSSHLLLVYTVFVSRG